MNKIEQMIKELCPEGVKWVKLGEIILNIRTGLNPRTHFELNTDDAKGYYITVRELKGFCFEVDDKTDRINDSAVKRINERSNLQVNDILFSGTGTIGRTALVTSTPTNWNIKEGVYAITPNSEVVLSKYLLFLFHTVYFLDSVELKAGGSTVRSIPMAEFKNLSIPLPPLTIQEQIVTILDKFESMCNNLEKELSLRRKQYEHYREKLLSFGEDVERKKFGDIGVVKMCKRILKEQTNSQSGIPFYKIGTFGKTADAFISKELFKEYKEKFSYPQKGDILISASGTIGRKVVFDGLDSYFQDSNIVWLSHNGTKITNNFLFFIYDIVEWPTEGGTIKRLYNDNFLNIEIPLPPLSTQESIVSKLDKFEALISNIERELELRTKQYEYYREKLLTF